MTTDVRAQLVAATATLLNEEGPVAVQARRVSREIGASTMAVYHYFGGMPGLLRAVADEGFARLATRIATVPESDDPVADVCRQALAYRAAAHANAHLYDLMFGLSTPGGTPAILDGARTSYAPLLDGLQRAMEADRIRSGDPGQVAAQFWSMLHGFVMLELAGQFGHVDDAVAQVLLPMGVNLLVGLGDVRERAARSALAALTDA